jgi:hypothetical protein
MSHVHFIEPQLATPVDEPPEGQHWIQRNQTLLDARAGAPIHPQWTHWTDRYPSETGGPWN